MKINEFYKNAKYEILAIIHAFKRYYYIVNSTLKLIYIYINYNFMMYKQKLNIFIKYYCNNLKKRDINFCSMITS